MILSTVKKSLESRMLGNLHVRFGVGGGVQLPALHHITDGVMFTSGGKEFKPNVQERFKPIIEAAHKAMWWQPAE
jgi:hypothetical protein